MTYLSRDLIRRMIIAEAARKAPLLNFDDQTEDMTDLDMSQIELTQSMEPLDIDKNTKMPTDLSPFYDDDDDLDDDYDDDLDVEEVSDFYSDTEEDSESYTYDNPLPKAAYDPSFRIRDDMTVSGDPMRRKPPEIKKAVHAIADELDAGIDKSKKSEAQREAEFLKRMEDMALNSANLDPKKFPTDPEFGPLSPEDTAQLPLDRKPRRIPSFFDSENDLSETIKKLVKESIIKKIKYSNKNKLY